MSKQCVHCPSSVLALAGESRTVALMRFVQLQQAGYLPAMCEAENGRYSVCYDARERRSADSSRTGAVCLALA